MAVKTETATTRWETRISEIKPEEIRIRGYSLSELVQHKSFLEVTHLIITGELPSVETLESHMSTAIEAVKLDPIRCDIDPQEDVSKWLAKCLLLDPYIPPLSEHSEEDRVIKAIFTLGRICRYLSQHYNHNDELIQLDFNDSFNQYIYCALTGIHDANGKEARLLERLIIANIDRGVTPPTTQVTRLASSLRASFEVALSNGVGAFTNIFGGNSEKASEFYYESIRTADEHELTLFNAGEQQVKHNLQSNNFMETFVSALPPDPAADALIKAAELSGFAAEAVEISQNLNTIMENHTGKQSFVNLDGVVGAIITDLDLPSDLAKVMHIFGRISGLIAHYYEEIILQPPMRRIRFEDAVYSGPPARNL